MLWFFTAVASDVKVEFNGIPCAKAYKDSTLYVSILAKDTCRLQVSIALRLPDDVSLSSMSWDENPLEEGAVVNIPEWRKEHTLKWKSKVNGVEDDKVSYKVVFTTLPVVCMDLEDDDEISKEEAVEGLLTIHDAEARTENSQYFKTNITAHYRGVTSLSFEKKSFSLKLFDEQDVEADHDIMGIRRDSRWILDAMAVDFSRMRNRVCFDVWNAMDVIRDERMLRNGSVGQYVELIYDGQYFGLYCLSDKVNRKLLGLKKTKGSGEDAVYHGLIYKCRRGSDDTHYLLPPDEEYSLDSESWFDWDLDYPSSSPSPQAWKPLIDLTDYAATVFTDADETYRRSSEFFYEENMVAYPLFVMNFMLLDNMMHNTYISVRDVAESSKCWITPWDLDGGFGRDGTGVMTNWLTQLKSTIWRTQPFRNWIEDKSSEYFVRISECWDKYKDNVLSPESVSARIDAYAKLFKESGAWTREYNRWNGNPQNLGLMPDEETSYMKSWYARNHQHLDSFFSPQTGISEIVDDASAVSGIYGIDGRFITSDVKRISQLPSGLYIVNGKKVMK